MIYLDHAATSPMTREVIEAMWPFMTQVFANSSSQHEMGKLAAAGLQAARDEVASLVGCAPGNVIFTSGGTESNNLAIKGVALANPKGRHIATSAIEHESVLQTCEFLKSHHGFEITVVGVDRDGLVDLNQLREALRQDTTLCTIQHANNEVGTVQPVDAIAAVCAEAGVLFHTDAVQAAGVLTLDFPAQLISISGHKFGGPKGVGVLINKGVPLEPTMHGGGQEGGVRSGTSNVAGAVGLAKALQLSDHDHAYLMTMRDRLISGILRDVPSAVLLGHPTQRLPQNAAFCFEGVSGEAVLLELEAMGIACSSGSACAAGNDEPSHVLRAMGIADDLAQTAVRFTLGSENTADEINTVIAALPKALANLLT